MLTVHYTHKDEHHRAQEIDMLKRALADLGTDPDGRMREIKVAGLNFGELRVLSSIYGIAGKLNKLDEAIFTKAGAEVPDPGPNDRTRLFCSVLFIDHRGAGDEPPNLSLFFDTLKTEKDWRCIRYVAVKGMTIEQLKQAVTIPGVASTNPVIRGKYVVVSVLPAEGFFQQSV